MIDLHSTHIKETLCFKHKNIPRRYAKEFSDEVLETNLIKLGRISVILLVMSILLLGFYKTILTKQWLNNPEYKYLYYSHIGIILSSILFLVFFI